MRRIPRHERLPIGTYILVKGWNDRVLFEYIGKVYKDGLANDRFTYLHNHTIVGIIDDKDNHISYEHTYNVTPYETVWIIESEDDWIEVMTKAL